MKCIIPCDWNIDFSSPVQLGLLTEQGMDVLKVKPLGIAKPAGHGLDLAMTAQLLTSSSQRM